MTNYPLETYAKAMEGLAELIHPTPIMANESPLDYALVIERTRGIIKGLEIATKMLQMSPSALYTVYPAFFPDPDAKEPTP